MDWGYVITIMASAMVVMLGLITLTRAVFKVAIDLKDYKRITEESKAATEENTKALTELRAVMDGRVTRVEEGIVSISERVSRIERTLDSLVSRPG